MASSGQWGDSLAHVEGLTRESSLDDGDWCAIRCTADRGQLRYNKERLLWYNRKTHEHRWELLAEADVVEGLNGVLASDMATYEFAAETKEWCCVLGKWRHTNSVAHSVPSTPPGAPKTEDWYGSAAADKALAQLRAADAASAPPPADDGAQPARWRRCASGGVVPLSEYSALRNDGFGYAEEDGNGLRDFGTHLLQLPRNGTAIHGRKLEWKQEPARQAAVGKTWRCLKSDWNADDVERLVDLARGFTISESKLPAVQRGALRIKGYPWTASAMDACSKYIGPGSQLEGLFVFADQSRAARLAEQVLDAVWTPVSFMAWEEEVLNYGLFDIVYDHTRCSGMDPDLEHCIVMLWANQCEDDDGCTRPPLTAAETYAALLARESCCLTCSIEQMQKSGSWPHTLPITAAEARIMLAQTVQHWASMHQVRAVLSGAREDHMRYFSCLDDLPTIELAKRLGQIDGLGLLNAEGNVLQPWERADPDGEASTSAESALSVKAHVQLHSLSNRKELNGQEGMLLTWYEDTSRWGVRLECGLQVLVRPQNLKRIEHMTADE